MISGGEGNKIDIKVKSVSSGDITPWFTAPKIAKETKETEGTQEKQKTEKVTEGGLKLENGEWYFTPALWNFIRKEKVEKNLLFPTLTSKDVYECPDTLKGRWPAYPIDLIKNLRDNKRFDDKPPSISEKKSQKK